MPYKAEKIKLPPELDRRRKLTDEQKDEIKHKYDTGCYSLSGLAKEYSVSKKTVLLIVNPKVNARAISELRSIGKIMRQAEKSTTPLQRSTGITSISYTKKGN